MLKQGETAPVRGTGPEDGGGSRHDDPKAGTILIVAAVGAILIFVAVVSLEAWFYRTEESERVVKVYSQVPEDLAGLRATQREQLSGYRWVDQARGTVSIPIDRAMELVVRDQGVNPSTGATKAAPALPAESEHK
jgi:hypothetical protein